MCHVGTRYCTASTSNTSELPCGLSTRPGAIFEHNCPAIFREGFRTARDSSHPWCGPSCGINPPGASPGVGDNHGAIPRVSRPRPVGDEKGTTHIIEPWHLWECVYLGSLGSRIAKVPCIFLWDCRRKCYLKNRRVSTAR